jgi:carboxyl-terminal processing protease
MLWLAVVAWVITAQGIAAIPGDFNDNQMIDLGDVILCQKMAIGIAPTGSMPTIEADVNADGRIGLDDAVYCLQVLADIRNHPDIDDDHDGFTEHQGDCNDTEATIYPGAQEICGDGIDQNCDAADLVCTPEITYVSEDFTTGPGEFFDLWGYLASNGRLTFNGDGTDYAALNYWNGGPNPGYWYPQPGQSNYFDDFYVTVDTYWNGGELNWSYGLAVCLKSGSSGSADWITFWVTKTGYYNIAKIEDNDYKSIVDWKPSFLLNISGQQNQLGIQKIENNYRYFINGYEVEQVTIEGFNGGAVGVVTSQKVNVCYDNFRVTNPYQGQIVIPSAGYVRQRNELIYKNMTTTYLWYDRVPAVPYLEYESAEDLVDDLRYVDLDRWSYIISKEEYHKLFEEGKYIGIGIGIAMEDASDCRIQFVYPTSPAAAAGLGRGDHILTINGKTIEEIETQSLWDTIFGPDEIGVKVLAQVYRPGQTPFNVALEKTWVTVKAVLHSDVKSIDGSVAGYLALNQFIESAREDIQAAFTEFSNQGVNAMILDLRYNSGGRLDLAKYLSELIAGSYANGKTFIKVTHNDRYSDWNTEYMFNEQENALGLSRLVVITTEASCSASEVVINSLEPFIEVIRIGGTTCGKPVGMYGYDIFDLHISPIEFRVRNANDEGDYFDGIAPTCSAVDDLSHDLGDPSESSLQEALYYIQTGHCSVSGAKPLAVEKKPLPARKPILRGFRREIGAL